MYVCVTLPVLSSLLTVNLPPPREDFCLVNLPGLSIGLISSEDSPGRPSSNLLPRGKVGSFRAPGTLTRRPVGVPAKIGVTNSTGVSHPTKSVRPTWEQYTLYFSGQKCPGSTSDQREETGTSRLGLHNRNLHDGRERTLETFQKEWRPVGSDRVTDRFGRFTNDPLFSIYLSVRLLTSV